MSSAIAIVCFLTFPPFIYAKLCPITCSIFVIIVIDKKFFVSSAILQSGFSHSFLHFAIICSIFAFIIMIIPLSPNIPVFHFCNVISNKPFHFSGHHYDKSIDIACSSFIDIVEWLYRPWDIKLNASVFLIPDVFLIFALLFWNQILICASVRSSSFAKSCLCFSVKYRQHSNSRLSLCNCSFVNAVLGLLSSWCCCVDDDGGDFSSFFPFVFLDLGPGKKEIIFFIFWNLLREVKTFQ